MFVVPVIIDLRPVRVPLPRETVSVFVSPGIVGLCSVRVPLPFEFVSVFVVPGLVGLRSVRVPLPFEFVSVFVVPGLVGLRSVRVPLPREPVSAFVVPVIIDLRPVRVPLPRETVSVFVSPGIVGLCSVRVPLPFEFVSVFVVPGLVGLRSVRVPLPRETVSAFVGPGLADDCVLQFDFTSFPFHADRAVQRDLYFICRTECQVCQFSRTDHIVDRLLGAEVTFELGTRNISLCQPFVAGLVQDPGYDLFGVRRPAVFSPHFSGGSGERWPVPDLPHVSPRDIVLLQFPAERLIGPEPGVDLRVVPGRLEFLYVPLGFRGFLREQTLPRVRPAHLVDDVVGHPNGDVRLTVGEVYVEIPVGELAARRPTSGAPVPLRSGARRGQRGDVLGPAALLEELPPGVVGRNSPCGELARRCLRFGNERLLHRDVIAQLFDDGRNVPVVDDRRLLHVAVGDRHQPVPAHPVLRRRLQHNRLLSGVVMSCVLQERSQPLDRLIAEFRILRREPPDEVADGLVKVLSGRGVGPRDTEVRSRRGRDQLRHPGLLFRCRVLDTRKLSEFGESVGSDHLLVHRVPRLHVVVGPRLRIRSGLSLGVEKPTAFAYRIPVFVLHHVAGGVLFHRGDEKSGELLEGFAFRRDLGDELAGVLLHHVDVLVGDPGRVFAPDVPRLYTVRELLAELLEADLATGSGDAVLQPSDLTHPSEHREDGCDLTTVDQRGLHVHVVPELTRFVDGVRRRREILYDPGDVGAQPLEMRGEGFRPEVDSG